VSFFVDVHKKNVDVHKHKKAKRSFAIIRKILRILQSFVSLFYVYNKIIIPVVYRHLGGGVARALG